MKKLLVTLTVLLALAGQRSGTKPELGGIQLLDGYSLKQKSAVDAAAWTIEGRSGLKINFESGPNEGSWADPLDHGKYAWYREQTVHGYRVRFAIVKPGLKTQWEPDGNRGLAPGNILLVTYLLAGSKSNHTANFSAKVGNAEELADALLMIMTFDPSTGKF